MTVGIACPVIGCGDDNGIDIFAIQDMAEVGSAEFGLLRNGIKHFFLRLGDVRGVHVAQRHAFGILDGQAIGEIRPPHSAAADEAHADAVIGADDALSGSRGCSGGRVRSGQSPTGCQARRGPQKMAAAGRTHLCLLDPRLEDSKARGNLNMATASSPRKS